MKNIFLNHINNNLCFDYYIKFGFGEKSKTRMVGDRCQITYEFGKLETNLHKNVYWITILLYC